MSLKYYRYFSGLMTTQEKWLNKRAAEGYHLIRVHKLCYEFEKCQPSEFVYCVEFVAEKSKHEAQDYQSFLEELGYRTFFKNVNVDYSLGKVRIRPWANSKGKIATKSSTYNRELLIVEKRNDGKPFELHTTIGDKINYCKILQRPYLCMLILSVALGIYKQSWVAALFAIASLLPLAIYQWELSHLKKQARIND